MEYVINESNFNKLIEGLREEANSDEYTDEGKKQWNGEINFILDGETEMEKWVRMINTPLFLYTYGERKMIKDGVLYVDSICYGKGKPNSYFAPCFWN